jgi:transcription factor SPN1
MEELVQEMVTACERDMDALDRGEPGLAKLKLLPRVQEQTSKQSLQDAFIDAGGLRAIREWLRLLPDNSLPNLTMRTSLLKIIKRLTPSITLESLKESKIGHAIRDIIFHEEEITSNKRVANEIAETWLRSIFGRDEVRSSLKASEEDMRRIVAERANRHHEQVLDEEDQEGGQKRSRSAIANLLKSSQGNATLFRVQPVSRVQRVKAVGAVAGSSDDRISKAVSARHGVKRSTATKVSVEGRGLQ